MSMVNLFSISSYMIESDHSGLSFAVPTDAYFFSLILSNYQLPLQQERRIRYEH